MGVDPAIAEEALILTAIGIGTAFVVLVLLLIVILLIGVFNRYLQDDPPLSTASDSQPDEQDPEARDRALAAALAVTAIRASRPQASLSAGEDA